MWNRRRSVITGLFGSLPLALLAVRTLDALRLPGDYELDVCRDILAECSGADRHRVLEPPAVDPALPSVTDEGVSQPDRSSCEDHAEALMRGAYVAMNPPPNLPQARRLLEKTGVVLARCQHAQSRLEPKRRKLLTMLLKEEHRPREALREARYALELAHQPDLLPHVIELLLHFGALAEAQVRFDELDRALPELDGAAVDKFGVVSSALWNYFQFAELSGRIDRERARRYGDHARRLAVHEDPEDPVWAQRVREFHINDLALELFASLQDGARPRTGTAAVLGALARSPEAHHPAWSYFLQGQLALVEERWDAAERAFRTAEELQDGRRGTAWPGWRVSYYRARTYEAQGDDQAALAAYEQADRTLGALARDLPFSELDTLPGSEPWLGTRRIDLLVRAGRLAEAVCVARLVNGRYLTVAASVERGLDDTSRNRRARYNEKISERITHEQLVVPLASGEQRQYELRGAKIRYEEQRLRAEILANAPRPAFETCAELSAPRNGEVFLVMHPLPNDRALVATVTSDGISHAIVNADGLRALDTSGRSAALQPLEPVLRGAERVCIFAAGTLAELPMHRLHLDDQPLSVSRPVAYCHDIPSRPRVRGSAGTVFVARKPRQGDGIARERALLDEIFPGQVSTASTLPEMLTLLKAGEASALHIGGHNPGVVHGIELDRGTSLRQSDVLPIRVPPQVFLASCETANLNFATPGGGLTMNFAFLSAGAHVVVGMTGNVEVDDLLEFQKAMYGALQPGENLDYLTLVHRAHARRAAAGLEFFAAVRVDMVAGMTSD